MYSLKVNDFNLYFKKLDSVKNWLIECGVDEELELEDKNITLDKLEELLEEGYVEVYNECLIERGDDYCVLELEVIEFED